MFLPRDDTIVICVATLQSDIGASCCQYKSLFHGTKCHWTLIVIQVPRGSGESCFLVGRYYGD
jgi:hypothetical protein